MESLTRSLNLQQAFQTEPNFDKYARQILENSKSVVATVATPTKIRNFIQELGATFINSIQLQNFQRSLHTNRDSNASANANVNANANAAAVAVSVANAFNGLNSSSIVTTATTTAISNSSNSTDMEIEYIPNQIIIDSSSFETMDEIQKQLEYDKFMNEVWIGIVLTLILISMIFCICSCFLYHQFRTWKRNYHSTVVQANSTDIESLKLNSELDDPVPEYTLVSGLPSYEAALELMQKAPSKSCLLVYPSVFNVFNKNERSAEQMNFPTAINNATSIFLQQQQQQQQQQLNIIDVTTPLLSNNSDTTRTMSSATTTTTTTTTTTAATSPAAVTVDTTILPKANEANANTNGNQTTTTTITTTTMPIDLTGNLNIYSAVNEKELLELLNETNTAATATANANANANANTNTTKPLEEVMIVKNEITKKKAVFD